MTTIPNDMFRSSEMPRVPWEGIAEADDLKNGMEGIEE